MDNLPKEILIKIFSYLDGYSLFHATKACQSWSDTINHSIEIGSKFCFKIHTGVNLMPDIMDLRNFSNFQFNFKHSKEEENIKILRFWPNLRVTEVCDIIDEKGEKFDELINIFNDYGILWKEIKFHDIKLQKISNFEKVFTTLVNCKSLSLTRCNVEESSKFNDDDQVMSDEHSRFESLEVTKVEWCVWKALKCFRKVKFLKVSSSTPPSTNDFHEFLTICENLTELSLFGSSKFALISSFLYKFKLEKLVIDRSNYYDASDNTNFSNLSEYWKFSLNQKQTLKKLKFKGKISEEMISKIANQMSLKVLNLSFVSEEENGENFIGKVIKNYDLEKLHCVGKAQDIKKTLKFFPAIKSLKLNGPSFMQVNNLMSTILQSTPQLTILKIFQPIKIPSELDVTSARFHQLHLCYINIPESQDVSRFLRLCPNLKKFTILTQFTGADLEQITNCSVEDFSLVVQNSANIFDVINNIFKLLQCFPNIKKLSLNSLMCGKILITPIMFEQLEKVKIDFTCTSEQCNNMYELLKRCPNMKSLEIASNLIGKFEVEENFKFQNLKSLSLFGIDENFAAFENFMKFVKISPKLQKLDFWIRGNNQPKCSYFHNKQIENFETFNCPEMREFSFTKFHKSEIEILLYLLKCFKNLQTLKIDVGENDLTDETLKLVLEHCKNVENLSLDKNFIWTAENLTIIKKNLKKLKKLEIFVKNPLKIQKILKEIFKDEDKLDFVINTNCLEEWKNDEIVRV